MRTVIVSDIHLGKYKYGKINNETGLDKRTEDILKNLDESIEFAIKKKVDQYIITGDFYHLKRPLPIFRRLLSSRINRLLSHQIEAFLLLGNHDQGKTSGHDLVELKEMSEHIPHLHVIDEPQVFDVEDAIFCFLPCINKIDFETDKSDHDFTIQQIAELSKKASESSRAVKMFFGHFGTNSSMAGAGFDLGTIESDSKKARIIPLDSFKEDVWTKVYLGDIHKPQMLNEFCRHVGSIARVDFGEEDEQKGFFYYEDGNEEFIELHDREFKTLEVDLTEDARETMGKFCEDIQDLEIDQSITRMKIRIKASDRKLINFKAIEEYLKEESWNYIGKTVTEVDDRAEEVSIDSNEELNYMDIFDKYVDSISSKLEVNIDELKKEGKEALSLELET